MFKPDYFVNAQPQNLIKGRFTPNRAPVITVPDGAIVRVETLNTDIAAQDSGTEGNLREKNAPGVRDLDPKPYFDRYGIRTDTPVMRKIIDAVDKVEPMGQSMHCMTGPIAIEGAQPGDMLEVRILDYEIDAPYGCMFLSPGYGGVPDLVKNGKCQRVLYNEACTFADLFGAKIPIDPFLGVMAVADVEDKPSAPPGRFGGNMDLKRLTMGTSLYLPVLVPGALFYVGDAHAAQGNGEVCITAIESCGVTGTFRFILHKNRTISAPQAETPTHYITMGLDADLRAAMRKAILSCVDFICHVRNVDFDAALMMASAAVDFEVTQVVDGTLGVHAMIPKNVFDPKNDSFWNKDGAVRYLGKKIDMNIV